MKAKDKNAFPRALVINWIVGSAVALTVAYYGIARMGRSMPGLMALVTRPITHPHALVSAFLLIALWATALHATLARPLLFWYETFLLWAMVAVIFVGIRMVMVFDPAPYNPSTFWWAMLLNPPVGIALLLAVLNSFMVTGIVYSVFQLLTRPRSRAKYASRMPSLLLTVNVCTLCITFVAILCIFPASSQNV